MNVAEWPITLICALIAATMSFMFYAVTWERGLKNSLIENYALKGKLDENEKSHVIVAIDKEIDWIEDYITYGIASVRIKILMICFIFALCVVVLMASCLWDLAFQQSPDIVRENTSQVFLPVMSITFVGLVLRLILSSRNGTRKKLAAQGILQSPEPKSIKHPKVLTFVMIGVFSFVGVLGGAFIGKFLL